MYQARKLMYQGVANAFKPSLKTKLMIYSIKKIIKCINYVKHNFTFCIQHSNIYIHFQRKQF